MSLTPSNPSSSSSVNTSSGAGSGSVGVNSGGSSVEKGRGFYYSRIEETEWLHHLRMILQVSL